MPTKERHEITQRNQYFFRYLDDAWRTPAYVNLLIDLYDKCIRFDSVPVPWKYFHDHYHRIYKDNLIGRLIRAKFIICTPWDQEKGHSRTFKLNPRHVIWNVICEYRLNQCMRRVLAKINLTGVVCKLPLDPVVAWIREHKNRIDKKSRNRAFATECILNHMMQSPKSYTEEQDGINYLYCEPAYKTGMSGRNFEFGFQQLPREVKQLIASYTGILNYDIKSCALSAFVIFCQTYGIDSSSLQYLIDNKDEYTRKTGLPESSVKYAILCLLHDTSIDGRRTFIKEIRNDYGPDWRDHLKNLLTFLEPFINTTQQIHSKIRELYAAGDKEFLDYPQDNPTISQLTACYYQRLESKLVDYLINASNQYGYQVNSNEFDGLTTHHPIPATAIEQARVASGFANAQLVLKPFL